MGEDVFYVNDVAYPRSMEAEIIASLMKHGNLTGVKIIDAHAEIVMPPWRWPELEDVWLPTGLHFKDVSEVEAVLASMIEVIHSHIGHS